MAEEQHLDLPRPLVNQLLHAAQLHTTQVHWGIISSHAGNPEQCHALNEGPQPEAHAYLALCATLTQKGEQVWALYCSTTGELVAPDPSVLQRMEMPRFLGISLGTKGVLQLRGWRVKSGHLQELEVHIRED